jgi:hypothetical protein
LHGVELEIVRRWPMNVLVRAVVLPIAALLPQTAAAQVNAAPVPGKVLIVGTLVRRDSLPSVGTEVFIGKYGDGRISYDYLVDMAAGRTTGLANPHCTTDSVGSFQLSVDISWFASGQQYTVAAFDYGGEVVIVQASDSTWTFRTTNEVVQQARRRGGLIRLGKVRCVGCA